MASYLDPQSAMYPDPESSDQQGGPYYTYNPDIYLEVEVEVDEELVAAAVQSYRTPTKQRQQMTLPVYKLSPQPLGSGYLSSNPTPYHSQYVPTLPTLKILQPSQFSYRNNISAPYVSSYPPIIPKSTQAQPQMAPPVYNPAQQQWEPSYLNSSSAPYLPHYQPIQSSPTKLQSSNTAGASTAAVRPGKCWGKRNGDTRTDLDQELALIPLGGTGADLTDRQLLLLLRLGRSEGYHYATEVYTNRGELRTGYGYLACMSDAFLHSVGLESRDRIPALSTTRRNRNVQANAMALWHMKYPSGRDFP